MSTPPDPGPVAEEAALLLDALRGWVAAHPRPPVPDWPGDPDQPGDRDHSAHAGGPVHSGAADNSGHQPADPAADGPAAPRGWAAVGQAPECSFCPVCRLMATLGLARPEVAAHLLDAATSLVAALRAGLESTARAAPPDQPTRPPVQRIDIT